MTDKSISKKLQSVGILLMRTACSRDQMGIGHCVETDWLHDFLVFAELESFSRAAEHRGIKQPAFSRRIRALEAWIGGLHPVPKTPS